ncbi:hypothetical protein [Streptomyces gardneri]|uniref:Peptidase M16 C-terminal domain-containing protein n=1 Tax=Streptomyces gardneri TaxID=66892 RepID=A0A4Y3RW81_9ACTN|nr:hypothetical protein [Streptomyces gardneri]GEB61802.1 hypothetical protein SGA01_74070 [Streptomyces gardneri]GHG93545.1 hypothetical protein GCM10017674_23340 [Streptomyces gardneri]
MPRPDTRTTRWGEGMDLIARPSHVAATVRVPLARPEDVMAWLCLCEALAGGFTSPLTRAGRHEGTLFRVRLALLPGTAEEAVLALTFTTSGRSEAANTRTVLRALTELADRGEVGAPQWESAARRLATRMATTDPLPPHSTWRRPPYDAYLDDPVAWATRTRPPEGHRQRLAEILRALSARRAGAEGEAC